MSLCSILLVKQVAKAGSVLKEGKLGPTSWCEVKIEQEGIDTHYLQSLSTVLHSEMIPIHLRSLLFQAYGE